MACDIVYRKQKRINIYKKKAFSLGQQIPSSLCVYFDYCLVIAYNLWS